MRAEIDQERQQAHALLDMLPGDKVAALRTLLEAMVEPSYTMKTAPVEQEELTPETAAAIARGQVSLERGEGIAHEEILREFGFQK
jgi:hypothetical protein